MGNIILSNMTIPLANMPVGSVGSQFIPRGNLNAWDWQVSDFVTDGTWRELDCSSIVPEGAVFIKFYLILTDNLVNQAFLLKNYDYANDYNVVGTSTQTANVSTRHSFMVPCNTDRKLKYYASNTTFTAIYLNVTGWVLGVP